MKKKGLAPVIAAFILLGVVSMSFVGLALFTDFNFSALGGSPIDCSGEVVTKTMEDVNSQEEVINGFTEEYNQSYAEQVWETHNFRVQDSEVKYDVCRT